MYGFILNMWIMKQIDENYLDLQIIKKRITTEQKNMIMATPQI